MNGWTKIVAAVVAMVGISAGAVTFMYSNFATQKDVEYLKETRGLMLLNIEDKVEQNSEDLREIKTEQKEIKDLLIKIERRR